MAKVDLNKLENTKPQPAQNEHNCGFLLTNNIDLFCQNKYSAVPKK
jgi:hypothetical protein